MDKDGQCWVNRRGRKWQTQARCRAISQPHTSHTSTIVRQPAKPAEHGIIFESILHNRLLTLFPTKPRLFTVELLTDLILHGQDRTPFSHSSPVSLIDFYGSLDLEVPKWPLQRVILCHATSIQAPEGLFRVNPSQNAARQSPLGYGLRERPSSPSYAPSQSPADCREAPSGSGSPKLALTSGLSPDVMQMLVRGVLEINTSDPKPVYTITFEPHGFHETGQSPPARRTRERFTEAEDRKSVTLKRGV